MTPVLASSVQLPSSPALPVLSLEPATSAPVAVANCSRKLLSAPTLQPYSKISPLSLKAAPISFSSAWWVEMPAASSQVLPSWTLPLSP